MAVLSAAERADWDRLAGIARVLSWTPLAAPYTIGLDVADGRAWAVPVKLLITALTIGALLRWWSVSLESAMLGTASGGRAEQAQPAGVGATSRRSSSRGSWAGCRATGTAHWWPGRHGTGGGTPVAGPA